MSLKDKIITEYNFWKSILDLTSPISYLTLVLIILTAVLIVAFLWSIL